MATTLIGLNIGLLLFLLTAGLTLIFGMLGVVNFAHGSLYMLGAYGAYQTVHWTGSFWLGLVVAPVAVGCLSAALERLGLKRLYHRDHVWQLLVTFGAALVLEEATRLFWGVDYKLLTPPPLLSGFVEIFGGRVSVYRLFVAGFGAAIAVLLFLGLEKTQFGVVVRAAASNSTMLSCMGVNVATVRTAVFAGGGAMAALGGALAGPIMPIEPSMGISIILDCFIVIVIGGLGNIRGAVAGALLIGMSRAFGQLYAPEWIEPLTYALLLVTLMVRPQGLFSFKGRTA
ncbi:MAG: branched-chain amino acid ABC transporter permease [Deferrisomatales bacterium]